MAYFQVTSADLRRKAEELKGLNQRFTQEEENLNGCHNALNSMWEGETKESFSREFNKDRTRMDAFKNAINQYTEALLSIAASYEDAENKNLSIVGSRSV